MTTRLDQAYFDWLTSQIGIDNGRTYNDLFRKMHETEFVWTVPNDDNRVQDGLDLRAEFLDGNPHNLLGWNSPLEHGVSVLEVLVALSRRVAFLAGGEPAHWACNLVENLGLFRASDPMSEHQAKRVEDILSNLIWRTYERDGRGGFFPLTNTLDDQTKLEIWQQMNAYVIEIQGE